VRKVASPGCQKSTSCAFDSNGNGFRDAILWEHVLEQLASAAVIALISNDHRAFAASKDQPGVLSPALVAEVVERGFDENSVRLFPDVVTFLRATGTVDFDAFAAVADIIEKDSDQLAANLTIAIGRARYSDRNGRARIFLERSHEPHSIDLVEVTAPDDSRLSLVTLQGDADVDLYVEWTDFDRGDLGGSTTRTVTYDATATYNHDTGLLDDFSVAEIRVDIDVNQLRLVREESWTPADLFRGSHLFGDGEEV
jgi:hypothetical protein